MRIVFKTDPLDPLDPLIVAITSTYKVDYLRSDPLADPLIGRFHLISGLFTPFFFIKMVFRITVF